MKEPKKGTYINNMCLTFLWVWRLKGYSGKVDERFFELPSEVVLKKQLEELDK